MKRCFREEATVQKTRNKEVLHAITIKNKDLVNIICEYDHFFACVLDQSIPIGIKQRIQCMQALPDGRLLTGCILGRVQIWNIHSGKKELTFNDPGNWITCFQLLPDGKLASGHQDSFIKIWNITSQECEEKIEYLAPIICLQLLTDGRLAIGSDKKTVQIWNLK